MNPMHKYFALSVMKLKAKNKWVIGFGKKESPECWKNVCDQFFEIDADSNSDSDDPNSSQDISIQELASITFDQIVKDDLVNLGFFQEALIRKKPNFVSEYKALKYSTMRKFIASMHTVFTMEYSKSDTVVVRKL